MEKGKGVERSGGKGKRGYAKGWRGGEEKGGEGSDAPGIVIYFPSPDSGSLDQTLIGYQVDILADVIFLPS